MRTTFVTPEEYAQVALRLTQEVDAISEKKPEYFKKVMYENRGGIMMFSPFGETEDGLEPKNPVVVALGDSVTAGHFEFLGNAKENFEKLLAGKLDPDDAMEVTDARVCYLEQFRGMLIDYYMHTSVSTINAGIAGDNMYGMQKRLYRDVLRYQPDMVIVNGTLNWGPDCGTAADFYKVLKQVVKALKAGMQGDIVLMTPNVATPSPFDNPEVSLDDRVEAVRQVAKEEDVCLVDAYKVWKVYEQEGYPVEALLANGGNHPSVTGHEMFARLLMRLVTE